MSSKPAQSTALERVASRRNVIRAAAWTAPAVSIVVAAPAFANTSPGSTPQGSASSTGSTRDGATLNLKSTFTAAARAVTGLQATVTVTGGTVSSVATPNGWTRSGGSGNTATFTYAGSVAAGANAQFQPVVVLTGNPVATVTSTVGFTWTSTGSASVSIPLDYVAPNASMVTAVAPRKYNGTPANTRHVEWKLKFTNGTQSLTNLSLDFSWTSEATASVFTVVTTNRADRTWSTTLSGLTATLNLNGASLAPGDVLDITADFGTGDNTSGTLGIDVYSANVRVAQVTGATYAK